MSEQTWLEEFYPIPADKCRGGIAAIKHSLRKWQGALRENLKKHNLTKPPIEYNTETCSLCVRYELEPNFDLSVCRKCPIYKTIAKNCMVAYSASVNHFVSPTNPEPMIKLLKKTLKFYQDKHKKPMSDYPRKK